MQIMQPLPANTAGRAELSPSYPPSYPQKVNPSAKYADPPANHAVPPCKYCRGCQVIPKLSPKLSPKSQSLCKICRPPCKSCSTLMQNMQTSLQILQGMPSYPQTNWDLKNKFKCFILTGVVDFTERAVSFVGACL